METAAVAQGIWFDGPTKADVEEITHVNVEHHQMVEQGLAEMSVTPSGQSCWRKTKWALEIDELIDQGLLVYMGQDKNGLHQWAPTPRGCRELGMSMR